MPNSHLMLVCQTAFNFTKLKTFKPANTLCICLFHSGHTDIGRGTQRHTLPYSFHSQWKEHEKKEDHLSFVIQYI